MSVVVVQSPAPVSTRKQLAGFSSQFFQPSPVDGHFNHFQSCPITNNAVKKKKSCMHGLSPGTLGICVAEHVPDLAGGIVLEPPTLGLLTQQAASQLLTPGWWKAVVDFTRCRPRNWAAVAQFPEN